MSTEGSLNLRDVINILEKETSPGQDHRYLDWAEVISADGTPTKRKDDFECLLSWQKITLYEIEARQFLLFAKQDLEEISERGLVNALRNAKSAIGCRIDELLALSNLKGLSSSRFYWNLPNDLPYKMNVLRTLGIPAPKVLKNLITQKRNLLEHEYVRPMEQQEIQNIVEIADLFLGATDQYVERGYITSATINCTIWLEKNGDMYSVRTGRKAKKVATYYHGTRNEYKLAFDLKNETSTVTHSEVELVREYGYGSLTQRALGQRREISVSTLAIPDCKWEDITELMILLRAKEQ